MLNNAAVLAGVAALSAGLATGGRPEAAPLDAPERIVFAKRTAPVVSPFAEPSIAVETRRASPMPIPGDDLLPPGEERPVSSAAGTGQAPPPSGLGSLTAFDEHREPVQRVERAEASYSPFAAQENEPQPSHQQYQRPWPPAPAAWNNPIRWINTHH